MSDNEQKAKLPPVAVLPKASVPRDALGNELVVGQMVQVVMQTMNLIGKVVEVSGGGVIMSSGREMTPAKVRIIVDVTAACPPGARIGNILRLVDPAQQEFLEKALESEPTVQ